MRRGGSLFLALLMGMAGLEGGMSQAAEPREAQALAIDVLAERALSTYTHGVWEVARQNLAVVRKAYELGRHPLLDVIAEQRRYIEVEMGYTDVLKRAYDVRVALERTLGVVPSMMRRG